MRTIILVMSETLPLSTVKARFSELVDRVAREQDRVTVTRKGRPAAVLVSPEDLASLEETLAVLSDHSSWTRSARATTISAEASRALRWTRSRPNWPNRRRSA